MKAIVIGSINKDIIFSVEKIASPGETIQSKGIEFHLGGKGLNQAVALSNMNKDVYFYGNVNKDDKEILNNLKQFNFHMNYIQKVEDRTGEAFIQVDKHGENSIVLASNANSKIDVSKVQNVLKNFERGDYVVFQNEVNDINELIGIAKKRELTVVLNPSPVTNKINEKLLEQVDYLIVNRSEFKEISGTHWAKDGMKKFHRKYPHIKLLVTLGPDGVYYIDQQETHFVPARDVEVADTTCAGDTFLGFFLGSLMNGEKIKDALFTATKAASICVSKVGASNSIPTIEQIK